MEYIFTKNNLKLLESFITPKTLLGLDFDGTLAPIVNDPTTAKMTKSTSELMESLNTKIPLAIITGRGINDVKNLLSFKPKYLIGNHGQEEETISEGMNEAKQLIAEVHKIFMDKFKTEMHSHEITIEDKVYSLSFHFRNSTNSSSAENFLSKVLKDIPAITISKGKMIYNVLPNNGANKGQAFLNALKVEQALKGIYLGDDQTDEDVFFHYGSQILAIRVGETSNSFAPFFLKGQDEIDVFLSLVLQKLRNEHVHE